MPAEAAYPNIRKMIREYPLADGASFLQGAAVLLTTGEVDECGADPATILGFALHDSGADPDTDIILVALATPESTFVMAGSAAFTSADEGVEYGIVKDADGIWTVDKTDAVNTRVVVEKTFSSRTDIAEVRVLAANCQFHS